MNCLLAPGAPSVAHAWPDDAEHNTGRARPGEPMDAAAARSDPEPPPPAPVSVRLKPGWFSSRPTVHGDQSWPRARALLHPLRRLKNLDGFDELASIVPVGLVGVERPIAEMSTLGVLFPPVAYAAAGAVGSARQGYARDYPDSVRRLLDQQRRVIDALSRDSAQDGDTADDGLAALRKVHDEARSRFEEREQHREKGFFALVKHNIASKWRHRASVGALSKDFIHETDRVIAKRRSAPGESETIEATYQAEVCNQREHERKQTKRTRLSAFFTGLGMPGMAAGMLSSMSASAAEAVELGAGNAAVQAAAQSAGQALETATCSVMIGPQLAQGVSGALNARIHAADHRHIRADLAAVRGIAPHLPAHVREVYEEDAAYRLAASRRNQVCDSMLTAGQALMVGANAAALSCPPAALPLAVPGAVLTVASTVANAVNDWQQAKHLGDNASEPVKERIRLGNLGDRLRQEPLGDVVRDVSTQFAAHQEQLVRTQLWNDIAKVLKAETSGGKPLSPAERYQRVLDRNHQLWKSGKLLPSGVKRLNELREKHYPETWFKGSMDDLQKRLSEEMRQHPASRTIADEPRFQKQVFQAAAADLARQPGARALFRDDAGRLLPRLTDKRFFTHLAAHEGDHALYRQRRNERLAGELRRADRFGRADSGDALSVLARVTMRRPEKASALEAEGRPARQMANFLASASGRSES